MAGKGQHTHVLRADTGIKSAQDVLTGLRDALAQHQHIAVDTQAVTAADITTVQTLLAARRKAIASGGSLRLLEPVGAPLQQVLAAGGFLTPGQADADFWPATLHQPTDNPS